MLPNLGRCRAPMRAALCLMAAVALTGPVSAQPVGTSREGPTALAGSGETPRRFPSIFGSASAFPSPGGTGFVGLTLVYPRQDVPAGTSGTELFDGDFALGYTVGNPVDNISATFGLTITSLKGFGEDGAFSIGLSRALYVGENALTFMGVSGTNLGAWGDAANDPPGYAAYVSHLFSVPTAGGEVPMQLTLGYGDRTNYDNAGITIGEGLFWGIGVGVSEQVSASIAGTENEVHLGLGLGLRRFPNWSVSTGVYDVFDNIGRQQFALSLSRGF
jgi:hypothetical protein